MERKKSRILWFKEISIKDVPLVGGKNASLGEMYCHLTGRGIKVPNGFAVTSSAYWYFLRERGLDRKIKKMLKGLDISDVRNLARVGRQARETILSADFPDILKKEILSAYKELSVSTKTKNLSVAVRSSATAEDLPGASFAGQQETYLNVRGEKELLEAVKKCVASLFTNRAISYREIKGFDHMNVALSVAVQQMVRSDKGSAGVMFTLDTESGFPGVVLINAAYGLGEYVVKGRVNPDQFYVFKEGVKQGKLSVISKILGTKEVKLVYSKTSGTRQMLVRRQERNRFALSLDDVIQLAKWGMVIEEHYGHPQDIEWARDGETGQLYIVQARPETVKAKVDHSLIETYILKKKGKMLVQGISVGQKIGVGRARVIEKPKEMKSFKKGEVLVTRITDPDWEPIMRLASAIVTEQGGKTSHAAIVSRELGVPCIVGASGARKILTTGKPITASCAEGDEGNVYDGILPFEVKKTKVNSKISTKTKIMMNVGDPDNAFALSYLPNDGVGLAREEFIFTNFIRIHPLALVNYNKLQDKAAKKRIAAMTRGYKNKADYCVDKLAEGIARIAVAMYPKDVIVRLSDFKTNEYATLVGGREFEPEEENPMLGWRGASRYYSKEYKPGFKLECTAIKKAREEWGLENIVVMVPFCRTPEEGEKVLATMAEFGLKRGAKGLRVYVMCEIPSNVILAEEFAKIFDGFSIGSNDLTQLTLGVDRDSGLVSHVYSEKNKAVVSLIKHVIKTARKHKRKVGICGQAPSDYPDFAEMLVREGIDSISLNPDTVVSIRERISTVERTLGRTGRRTNGKFLGMVAVIGVLGAALIWLGSGCTGINNSSHQAQQAFWAELSPAAIRKKIEEVKAREQAEPLLLLKENTFAHFSLRYPFGWTVEHWQGGITLKNESNDEYVSLFRQLVGHPVLKKTELTLGNKKALSFTENYKGKGGGEFKVVEIDMGQYVFEVNSNAKDFEKIIATLQFNKPEKGMPDKSTSHWDVREGKICVQMITYARPNKKSGCQMFSTPCDVPDGWEVCDQGDAN